MRERTELRVPSGVLNITADQYHADPAEQPSLSASIAHTLLEQSPAHAYASHPRLGGGITRDDDTRFELGTIAHALLLQGVQVAEVIDAPDWRTNAAKEARDAARAAGRLPLLAKHWDAVQEMVAAAREQLAGINADPPILTDGKPELTIVWQENGVHCRARLDWLRDDHAAIDDLKTASRSASPHAWTRTMFGIGADIQARFYQRGVKALTGTEPEFRFVVVETAPPYAVSVVSLAPSAAALADEKIDRAIEVWKRCLETGEWPGYPTRVCYAEAPGWAEAQWLERDALEAA